MTSTRFIYILLSALVLGASGCRSFELQDNTQTRPYVLAYSGTVTHDFFGTLPMTIGIFDDWDESTDRDGYFTVDPDTLGKYTINTTDSEKTVIDGKALRTLCGNSNYRNCHTTGTRSYFTITITKDEAIGHARSRIETFDWTFKPTTAADGTIHYTGSIVSLRSGVFPTEVVFNPATLAMTSSALNYLIPVHSSNGALTTRDAVLADNVITQIILAAELALSAPESSAGYSDNTEF